MKIVFMAPFGMRPKGTVPARMVPLAAALREHGHEVVIVAPPYTNPEDSGKVETVRGVTVRNIILPTQGGKAAVTVSISRALYRAALDEKPDLIHLFKPKGYGGLAAMLILALKGMGVRMPSLFVDTDDWEGKGGMNLLHGYSPAERFVFALQEKWLPPRAAGVTVASRALETMAWGMGVPAERVLYVPNCVDDRPRADGAQARQRLGIPPEAPVVLLYTRFFEFGADKLHFLFADMHRRVPGVRFLVVGKGRRGEEEQLVEAARRAGFAEALVMAGWTEPVALPEVLAAADVAIYPFDDTLVNRAKCPAKLTELLVAGIPVVGDSVGQIAEYISPGGGILCSPERWQEMADGVVALLNDPVGRSEMAAAGRRHIVEAFDWKTFGGKLDLFYRGLVGEK